MKSTVSISKMTTRHSQSTEIQHAYTGARLPRRYQRNPGHSLRNVGKCLDGEGLSRHRFCANSRALLHTENTALHNQLRHFQQRKLRLGMIVDEYGDILGLVRLRIFSRKSWVTLLPISLRIRKKLQIWPTVALAQVAFLSETSIGNLAGHCQLMAQNNQWPRP